MSRNEYFTEIKFVPNSKRSLHENIFFPIFKNNQCMNWSVLHSENKCLLLHI